MEKLYLDYLFRKHKLVHSKEASNPEEVVRKLKDDFDITIVSGAELADEGVLDFDKTIKLRKTDDRNFEIITEQQARDMITESCTVLLTYSEHITKNRYELVKEWLRTSGKRPETINHKATAAKLLADTRDMYYTRFLGTKHVLSVVRRINETDYKNNNLRQLNLKNTDRKFVEKVIRATIRNSAMTEEGILPVEVKKKRRDWNGLLHHIHFVACTQDERTFLDWMRNNGTNGGKHAK